MKNLAILFVLIAVAVSGCAALTELSSRGSDHLLGWYELQGPEKPRHADPGLQSRRDVLHGRQLASGGDSAEAMP